jgi:GntR family transcriptional regulator
VTGPAIDRLRADSPDPLYLQLSSVIEARISSGAMRPGDRLEAEHDLAKTFGVSRITVRHAIATLVEKDLLVRRQGKGTFVSRSPIARRIDDPIFDAILSQGAGGTATLTAFELRTPPPEIAAAFGTAGDQLIYLERQYSLDGEVMACATAWLVAEAASVPIADARTMSTAQILGQVDRAVVHTQAAIRAVRCPDALVGVLGLAKGERALCIRRRRLSEGEQMVELGEIHFRADAYEITLDANGFGQGRLQPV